MSNDSALGRVLERSRGQRAVEGRLSLEDVEALEEPRAGATTGEAEQWREKWTSVKDAVTDGTEEAGTLFDELVRFDRRIERAAQLRTNCAGLWEEFEQVLARVPGVVQTQCGSEHPAMEIITRVNYAAKMSDDSTDFDALERELEPVEVAQLKFLNAVTKAVPFFERLAVLHRIYADELRETRSALATLGKRVYLGEFNKLAWSKHVSLLERMVIPDNRDMNRGTGEDVLARLRKLFEADFVEIDATSRVDFYESSYDRAEDQFGGSWSLKAKGTSGKMQWLQVWEFHIHGKAVRDGERVAGFEILAGHIKPSNAKLTTGNSIAVPNTYWPAVINASTDKFVRWARKPESAEILRGKKRI